MGPPKNTKNKKEDFGSVSSNQSPNSSEKIYDSKDHKKDLSYNAVQSYRIVIMSLLFCLISNINVKAQTELLLGGNHNVMKFSQGKVFLANGDSIACELKVKSNRLGLEALLLKQEGFKKQILTPDKVLYFKHGKEEYVPYDHMFLQIILEGKIRLFKHTHVANHYHLTLSNSSGFYLDEYIVLKNGELIKIKLTDKERGYHKKMIQVFGDDIELKKKINKRNYKRGEFSQMIALYNEKHN